MKKLALTLAIVLGLGMASFAQGGMFQRGVTPEEENGIFGQGRASTDVPMLPGHDLTGDQDTPLGTGIAVLAVLGGAYLVGKKRREE